MHSINQGDEGTLLFECGKPRTNNESGLVIRNANLNVQTGALQRRRTTFAARRWINHRDDDTGDAGINQDLPARWRAAVVVAWLQRDNRAPATSAPTRRGECSCFRMRFTFAFVVSLADDVLVPIKKHTAHWWVRTGRPQPER